MDNFKRLQILLSARDETRRPIASVGKNIARLTSRVTIAGAAMKAAIASVGIAGGRAFSEIERASRLLGEPVREVQKLSEVVKSITPGAGIDQVQEGLLTLTERFAEAREGSGEAFEVFKRLGLDTSLDKPIEQLEAVRDVISRLPSDSERLQLTRVLFGDEDGNAILGYLRASAETVERIKTAVETSGRLFSDEQIANMRAANRSISSLTQTLSNARVEVFARMAPEIQHAADLLNAFVRTAIKLGVRLNQSALGQFSQTLRGKLGEAFIWLIGLIERLVNGAFNGFNNLSKAVRSVSERMAGAIQTVAGYVEAFMRVLNQGRDFVANSAIGRMAKFIGETLNPVLERAAKLAGSVRGAVVGFFSDDEPEKAAAEVVEGRISVLKTFRDELAALRAEQSAVAAGFNNLDLLAPTGDAANDPSARAPVPVAPRGNVVELIPSGSGNPIHDQTRDEYIERMQEMTRHTQLMRDTTQDALATWSSNTQDQMGAAKDSIQSLQSTMGELGNAMTAFSQLSGRENSKAFKSFQKLQVALSLAAAWAGAAQTLADPTLPYLTKAAAFVSILGTGLNAVNQIKSLNENSTSAGGGSAAPTVSAGPQGTSFQNTSAQQGNQRQITVNIQGNAPISTDQLEDFIRELNDNDTGLRIQANRIAA